MRRSRLSCAIHCALIGLFGIGAAAAFATAAEPSKSTGQTVWTLVDRHAPEVEAAEAWIRPARGQSLVLNVAAMREALNLAPLEGTLKAAQPMVMLLPDPTGKFQAFHVLESPIMEPGLAAQFPDIKTIVGQGIDDPTATLRADITPQGFHAQVLSAEGHWYIDPYSKGDAAHYASYYKSHLKQLHRMVCELAPTAFRSDRDPVFSAISSGTQLRTYRLANAATGEYTAFHGGTVALGQAAIVTAINRVTGVYERDVAVRLTLVANNSSLVYTNSATDPYTNGNGSTMLGQNQTNCNTVIGSANYDIGHVFSTGGGGIAGLGVVCGASKAQGVTGQTAPTGDPFYIDYVAHEMGHQFGGNHCFNSSTGSCSGNRNGSTAYEPGSASTIMGYAGICGTDDLQPNSDAYFHSISYEEIRNFVGSGGGSTCGTLTATSNTPPSVTGPGNFTIPKGTPIFLTATASDVNGDPLTYCWEERALGPTATLATADQGSIPLVRSLNPSTSPTRFIPPLANVLANTVNAQQRLPQVSRSWLWRVTVRDNRLNGGGANQADSLLNVVGAAGPFVVTAPSGAVSWPALSVQTVSWNVAGTDANGINCANVAIDLSTDGGNTFPIVVTSSTPNTGSANITVPNNQTTAGRLRVRGVGNIFYNVNQGGNITITAPVSGVALSGTGSNTFTDTTGNGNSNARIDPGESDIRVTVPLINNGTIAATGVTGTLVSNTATVSVVTNSSSYNNLAASGGTGSNLTPYVISVSPSHPCGSPISLTLNIASTQGTGTHNFSFSTGQPGGPGSPTTFTYFGAAVPIPDNNPAGATASVAVTGISGTISKVTFSILGSTCNATAGSTSVGLDHTFVGDLTGTLTSPASSSVTLFAAPGGTNNGGNNFCNTVFDDAGGSSIQSITAAGNPWTGTFQPSSPLSAFNGQNANGTWTFKVVDAAGVDTGNIRSFSITITAQNPPTCDPPVTNVCPQITAQPGNVAGCLGGTAVFSVTATGTPAPTYQWRKGLTNLSNGGRFSGVDTPTLTITGTLAADIGGYNCVASNVCGNAPSNSGNLTICVADYNCANGVSVQDIFDFLAGWFANDPRADVNGVSGIGVQDIFDFLAAWFIGCP